MRISTFHGKIEDFIIYPDRLLLSMVSLYIIFLKYSGKKNVNLNMSRKVNKFPVNVTCSFYCSHFLFLLPSRYKTSRLDFAGHITG